MECVSEYRLQENSDERSTNLPLLLVDYSKATEANQLLDEIRLGHDIAGLCYHYTSYLSKLPKAEYLYRLGLVLLNLDAVGILAFCTEVFLIIACGCPLEALSGYKMLRFSVCPAPPPTALSAVGLMQKKS